MGHMLYQRETRGYVGAKSTYWDPDTWEEGRGAVDGQEAGVLFAVKGLEKGASRHLGDDGPPPVAVGGRMRAWRARAEGKRAVPEDPKRCTKELAKASQVGFWVESDQRQVGGPPGARRGPSQGREGRAQCAAWCLLLPYTISVNLAAVLRVGHHHRCLTNKETGAQI